MQEEAVGAFLGFLCPQEAGELGVKIANASLFQYRVCYNFQRRGYSFESLQ